MSNRLSLMDILKVESLVNPEEVTDGSTLQPDPGQFRGGFDPSGSAEMIHNAFKTRGNQTLMTE